MLSKKSARRWHDLLRLNALNPSALEAAICTLRQPKAFRGKHLPWVLPLRHYERDFIEWVSVSVLSLRKLFPLDFCEKETEK